MADITGDRLEETVRIVTVKRDDNTTKEYTLALDLSDAEVKSFIADDLAKYDAHSAKKTAPTLTGTKITPQLAVADAAAEEVRP